MNPGVYGTAWEVHGGGFYHVEKYVVAPAELPPDLIWYKWEAYLTWATGFALLIVQYYFNASAYLIDPAKIVMTPGESVLISAISLAAGWFLYDRLCRSAIGRSPPVLAALVFLMILAFAYLFTHVFSGRGALIHVGALIGTMMAANVFAVIIPNQKIMVGQLMRGEQPDGELGRIGKQRSVHNNYLTLPVLLFMVSNHYPMLTGSSQAWLIAGLIIVGGAMVRHFLNRHDAGDPFHRIGWTLPLAAAALAAAMVMTAPRHLAALEEPVSDGEVLTIVAKHCAMCHSARPSHAGFDAPPKGIVLGSLESLHRYRDLIMTQAVRSDAMPLGNETGMTGAERARLGAWLAAH